MAKVLRPIYGPVLGLIVDGPKGLLRGTINLAAVTLGGPMVAFAQLAGAVSAAFTKTPSVPNSQAGRLTASVDPRAFRKTVLGSTAMATDVRYEEWSGSDQDYCDWIVCLASHAIDGLDEIWLNDELAWRAGVVQGKFVGFFSVPNVVLEGSPANTFTFASGKWNGAHRLTGCAYLRMRFKVTKNGKKDSPFNGGPTNRMTIVGRGARLYDPRRDSTVGGSGPMRAADQSTWRYTTDDGVVIGENLPLQILRVLLGWRITNPATGAKRLATGVGVPAKRLQLDTFMVAASIAEELVNRSAGGTEPRYAGAGVISEGDDPKTTLDALCAGCLGRFLDTGGRLSLTLAHNDLAEMATDEGLLTADVVGPFTWDPDPALEQTPNIIRGRYVDATAASLYQLIDYPEVRLDSPDGIDRIMTLDLGVCESASQAQRIAKQVLQRRQYQRSFTAPFDIRAWAWPVGKVVPFTFAPLGFVRRPMRVIEQEYGEGGVCNMTLREEAQVIYAWDRDDRAAVQPAAAVIYDPTRTPLLLAVNEALAQADASAALNAAALIVRYSVFPVSSTSTTIKVVAFNAALSDGTASYDFPAFTITGLTAGTPYLVIYDRSAGTYAAYPEPAIGPELVDPDNVIVRSFSTQLADGTYPTPAPAPSGDGGGGYGGGGRYQQNVVRQ